MSFWITAEFYGFRQIDAELRAEFKFPNENLWKNFGDPKNPENPIPRTTSGFLLGNVFIFYGEANRAETDEKGTRMLAFYSFLMMEKKELHIYFLFGLNGKVAGSKHGPPQFECVSTAFPGPFLRRIDHFLLVFRQSFETCEGKEMGSEAQEQTCFCCACFLELTLGSFRVPVGPMTSGFWTQNAFNWPKNVVHHHFSAITHLVSTDWPTRFRTKRVLFSPKERPHPASSGALFIVEMGQLGRKREWGDRDANEKLSRGLFG